MNDHPTYTVTLYEQRRRSGAIVQREIAIDADMMTALLSAQANDRNERAWLECGGNDKHEREVAV